MVVKCVFASQVKCVLWEVNNTIIHIQPTKYNYVTATLPTSENSLHARTTMQFHAIQIPLALSNATTIYRVSPSTCQSLYVPTWSYRANWPYLVLSQAPSIDSLFLGTPLDMEKNYSMPKELFQMLRNFETNASPANFDYSKLDISA